MRAPRYKLLKRLALGGMAEVYEGISERPDGVESRVAIKKIRPDHEDDPSFNRMFLDEARLASQLHHPNIVAVIDYGTIDKVPFQALEFVDGRDARAFRSMGVDLDCPIPVAVALYICRSIALGLDHAHKALDFCGSPLGIVHRDVSPGNILISWGGDVKLTDFGIAFALDRSERTANGVTKGKLAYMAPEQLTQGDLDCRTDVFSLGCVLHMLITGKSPLSSKSAFRRLLTEDRVDLDPDLPSDVSRIVKCCTHCDPNLRYQSAMHAADAIGAALVARGLDEPKAGLRDWLSEMRMQQTAPPVSHDRVEMELVLASAGGDARAFELEATIADDSGPYTLPPTRSLRGEGMVDSLSEEPSEELTPILGMGRKTGIESRTGAADFEPYRPHQSVPLESAAAAPLVTGDPRELNVLRPWMDQPTPALGLNREALQKARARRNRPTPLAFPRHGSRGVKRDADPVSPELVANPEFADNPELAESSDITMSAEDSSRGQLWVGGAEIRHLKIYVDDCYLGAAPRLLWLPEGPHEVELRRDGQAVFTKKIEIRASNPQSWSVGAR